MKILIITADFPPVQSGEANHALYLATHLAERGLEVEVLTSRVANVCVPRGVKVHAAMGSWRWRSVPRFRRFLRRCAPDAVLLLYLGSMYGKHPMITFAATIAKRVLPGAWFVTQFEHIDGTSWPQPLLTHVIQKAMRYRVGPAGTHFLYGSLLRDSDRIIVLSDMHRAHLSAYFAGVDAKSTLIPPPPIMRVCDYDEATAARARASLGLAPEHFVVLYYGYIYPGKGVETLLRAAQIASRKHPELRLVLCGGFLEHPLDREAVADSVSYEARVKAMPDVLGIADKVVWTGACPVHDERASLYMHAADASAFPFDTGVHLNNSSVVGAVAHGLPLITTRETTTEEAFVDGTNCLLCPPKDAEAMAAAMQLVIERPKLKETLRRGALTLANDWFSLDRIIDRTADALRGRFADSPATDGSAPVCRAC